LGIRGKQSAASTEIAVISRSGVSVVHRPQPPVELTAEQADEWRAIVNRLPADHFPRETHGMLTQYCRHVVAARKVGQLIAAFEAEDPVNVEAYDRLLKMQEREGRAISSLATRMRTSQHSQYAKDKKRGPVITESPWSPEDED
jgi:hypothetical protein